MKTFGLAALFASFQEKFNFGSSIEFEKSDRPALIFLVGDGMPTGVLKAMEEIKKRIYNQPAAFTRLIESKQTQLGLQKTASLSSIVTDSAPASAAWATGSKTVNGSLAVLPDGQKLKTILELLKEQDLSCGLVTTTRITHATPAAWYSHNADRDKEAEIVFDLLKLKPEVALGGGRRYFDPDLRKDGQNLLQLFSECGYLLLESREQLLKLNNFSRPLLGLFASSHLNYSLDCLHDEQLFRREPALSEMTAVALKKLALSKKGFILQVEAGRIDHANHLNDAWTAIVETIEFDRTLEIILRFLERNPKSLLIIASDHGNAGWGINGTGEEYNAATPALLVYARQKASFATIKKLFIGKSAAEIATIFEDYTGFKLTSAEAELLFARTNDEQKIISGDFLFEPEATMARILGGTIQQISTSKNNDYLQITAIESLRGNVGFTSTNHTAEDQIIIASGYRAAQFALNRRIDNTALFNTICQFFNLKYQNPQMSEDQATALKKKVSALRWKEHCALHIS